MESTTLTGAENEPTYEGPEWVSPKFRLKLKQNSLADDSSKEAQDAVAIPDTEVSQLTSRIVRDSSALLQKGVQWLVPSFRTGLLSLVFRAMILLAGAMLARYLLTVVAAALVAVDEYIVLVTSLWQLFREQVE